VFIREALDVSNDLLEFSHGEVGESRGKLLNLECCVVAALCKLATSGMVFTYYWIAVVS